jgi:hypothetical protein
MICCLLVSLLVQKQDHPLRGPLRKAPFVWFVDEI